MISPEKSNDLYKLMSLGDFPFCAFSGRHFGTFSGKLFLRFFLNALGMKLSKVIRTRDTSKCRKDDLERGNDFVGIPSIGTPWKGSFWLIIKKLDIYQKFELKNLWLGDNYAIEVFASLLAFEYWLSKLVDIS